MMEGPAVVFLIFGFIGIAIVFRLVAGGMDGDRIAEYARNNGWQLLTKHWEPFGPGWFGEKNARIYRITYRDLDGAVHEAHVKTSMLSGVYLTQDRVVEPASTPAAPPPQESLEEENRRLRERIRQLERGGRQ